MYTCKKCNLKKPIVDFPINKKGALSHYTTCKVCKNAYQKQYSKTEAGKRVQVIADQARKEKFAEKRSARSKTYHAILKGRLIPTPCLICGDKAEAHHHDYSRPLDVMWLCRNHHMEAHNLTK